MYDIITLGSSTIDVFIKTDVEKRKHFSHSDFCYHQGEKILINNLFFSTGGGGTNSSVAFSRLGLKTGYLGIVGSDLNGQIILQDLQKEKVSFLGKKKTGNSGYSIIMLQKPDRTILVYKGVNNLLELNDFKKIKTKWIYFSTMLGKSFSTAQKIAELYSKNTKIASNISQYEASLGISKLSNFLSNVDILILNKEEAYKLCNSKDIKNCSNRIMEKIREILVITDGPNPIHVCTKNSLFVFSVKKTKDILDTTGAGDAFASGFVYGIINKKNIKESISYGIKESKSVIKYIGAKQGLLRKV